MGEQKFWDCSLALLCSVPVSGVLLAVGGIVGSGKLMMLGGLGLVCAPIAAAILAVSMIAGGDDD